MPTRSISVRIAIETVPELKARATRAGMKTSAYMAQAVYEKLDNEGLRQEMENLKETVDVMRLEMAKATRAMLIVAGSKEEYSKELAENWVSQNLGFRESSREGKES